MTATKNEIVVLEGLCKWANVPPRPAQKIKPEDVKTPDHANNTSYSIMVECSEDQFRAFKAKKIPPGTLLHEDVDTDGKLLSNTKYMRIHGSKVKGEYEFPDPIVKNSDGTNVTVNIGNGSRVRVAVEIAPNPKKGGHVLRLRGVQVLELVEWVDTRTESSSEDIMNAFGISEPEPLPSAEDIFGGK